MFAWSEVPGSRTDAVKVVGLQRNLHCTIRNLEPNCQSYSYSYSSVPRLSPNLRNPLKIFAGLSKHLPVFLLGTENVMGGWMAILVVVCGKICGKMCGKKSKKKLKKLKKK